MNGDDVESLVLRLLLGAAAQNKRLNDLECLVQNLVMSGRDGHTFEQCCKCFDLGKLRVKNGE